LTYWFDNSRGTGFCLIDAPDIETAMRVHDEAHGEVADDAADSRKIPGQWSIFSKVSGALTYNSVGNEFFRNKWQYIYVICFSFVELTRS
jgi:hypothetical protein